MNLLQKALQPPPTPPLSAPPGHPSQHPHRPTQRHPTGATNTHHLVRTDIIDPAGKVTLRHAGHLYKIGVGRLHARTPVLILVENLQVRIIDAATGEVLRPHFTLDTTRTYQPTGRPPGPPPRKNHNPEPN